MFVDNDGYVLYTDILGNKVKLSCGYIDRITGSKLDLDQKTAIALLKLIPLKDRKNLIWTKSIWEETSLNMNLIEFIVMCRKNVRKTLC